MGFSLSTFASSFQNVQLLPPPNFTGGNQQNFLHTFPRNQPTQSLRTTQSGMPADNVIQCCNTSNQRRKTVTFLEDNSQDNFPLPPPPLTEEKSSSDNSPNEYVESRV